MFQGSIPPQLSAATTAVHGLAPSIAQLLVVQANVGWHPIQEAEVFVSPCRWVDPWWFFQGIPNWLKAASYCCAGRLGLALSIARTLAALKVDGPLRYVILSMQQSGAQRPLQGHARFHFGCARGSRVQLTRNGTTVQKEDRPLGSG